MPSPVVTPAASIMCPHAGTATVTPAGGQVMVSGMPAAVLSSPTMVAGCPFQIPAPPGTIPSPCLTVTWIMGATRVLVGGQPLLVLTASGLCQSPMQAPQGPPAIVSAQMRVLAS